MKILLLTDRLTLGGAETHILTLYRALTERGHDVTVVSCGGSLSRLLKHVNIDLSSRSPFRLLRSYLKLRTLILRERFELLHAHARLPALIASHISRAHGIPLVTTVHARFKLDPLRRAFSVWGDRTIAVSEDLRCYLTKEYSIPPENITVIENSVDFSVFSRVSPLCAKNRDFLIKNTSADQHSAPFRSTYLENDFFNVAFLSRLDSDCSLCAELLCKLAPRLLARYPHLRISIGGGGERLSHIKSLARRINEDANTKLIRVYGEVRDVPSFLRDANVFVGVSRAALEAIAAELPVILAGNEGFLGRLTKKNYSLARSTNFCARKQDLPTQDALFSALCSLIDGYPDACADAKQLCKIARSELDVSLVASRYEDFYRSVFADCQKKVDRHPKTLLFGYYGYSNLGDDALLRASITRARREFGSSVGAFTHAPKKASRIFLIPCFSRKNPIALFSKLCSCQRLIFGGGTLFQSSTSTRSLIFYLCVLRLAQALKKDTLLYANGIGEIKNARLMSALLKSLQKCSYVGLRDENSVCLLRRSLPNSKNITPEPDLTLSLAPSTSSRADFLLNTSLKERADKFFVAVPHFAASRFELFELDTAIKREKKKGLSPLFIACSPKDIHLAHSLTLKFGGALLSNLSFSDLLAIFPRASLVVSMRYHPLLAARTVSTPLLPIGSDIKLLEFFS